MRIVWAIIFCLHLFNFLYVHWKIGQNKKQLFVYPLQKFDYFCRSWIVELCFSMVVSEVIFKHFRNFLFFIWWRYFRNFFYDMSDVMGNKNQTIGGSRKWINRSLQKSANLTSPSWISSLPIFSEICAKVFFYQFIKSLWAC